MKKIILLFLPIILFSSLFGNDKLYSFIGVQTSISQFNEVTAPTIGIKYGKQSKEIRTSLSLKHGQNGDNSFDSLILEIDTGILTQNFRNIPFKPYIGASFGMMQHKNKKLISYTDKGYVYGINTGLSYVLNNNVDFDLAYRFLKTAKMKEIDSINDLSFSMHYFY